MSFTIGFAGKGGTGKSTIASIVTRYLVKKGLTPVLAIDADPNSMLGQMLALDVDETIVGIIDDISANIDKLPVGITKERLIESRVQQSLGEGEGFDLLVMGRPEGPGCYCYPNSMLREVIVKLGKAYKFIVMDNEAGMEHLSRRTARKIDYFFLVSDPTLYGIDSAKRILDLATELKVSKGTSHLIINRARGNTPALDKAVKNLGIERVDYLNESASLMNLSIAGKPMSDLPEDDELVKSVYKICESAKWR